MNRVDSHLNSAEAQQAIQSALDQFARPPYSKRDEPEGTFPHVPLDAIPPELRRVDLPPPAASKRRPAPPLPITPEVKLPPSKKKKPSKRKSKIALLEEENQTLKNEVERLKALVRDLKDCVFGLKQQNQFNQAYINSLGLR